MTAREEIRAKPPEIQTVIQVYMTVKLLENDHPTDAEYETAGRIALDWWQGLIARYLETAMLVHVTEIDIAKEIIERLRKQDVWGRILRGDAN